jgi:hypothetical protein
MNELLKSVAPFLWPAVVIVVAVLFRKQIPELLMSVKKAKIGWFEIERELKEIVDVNREIANNFLLGESRKTELEITLETAASMFLSEKQQEETRKHIVHFDALLKRIRAIGAEAKSAE